MFLFGTAKLAGEMVEQDKEGGLKLLKRAAELVSAYIGISRDGLSFYVHQFQGHKAASIVYGALVAQGEELTNGGSRN